MVGSATSPRPRLTLLLCANFSVYCADVFKIANTPDGFVVRDLQPTGESAWRLNRDGNVSRCLDHKGPWVSARPHEAPKSVRDLLNAPRL